MFGIKRIVRWVLTALLGAVARHRAVTTAVLSTLGSATSGFIFTSGDARFGVLAIAVTLFLLLLTGAVPGRYAAADLLRFMLPGIYQQLSLREGERVTIHVIRSTRGQEYEQLTGYWPDDEGRARGRIFKFSHGIVGQCFINREPTSEQVPEGMTLDDWMRRRWSFTKEERLRVTPDRLSFFAYPIGQEGPFAQAVLYVDSPDRQRLSEEWRTSAVENLDRVFLPLLKEALRRA